MLLVCYGRLRRERILVEVLSPGVEDGEEADVGAEVVGVPGDGEQGLGGGAAQDGEDDVEVPHR